MNNKQMHQIEECWEIALDDELPEKLLEIYEGIPSGDCIGCGRCCSESVPISFFELMNVDEYLRQNGLAAKMARRIVEFYFTEFIKRRSCPFLTDDKKCQIYEVRPLTCRIYGHMTEAADKKSYQRVLDANKATKDYLKAEYDIEVPIEVVDFKIPYCKDFKVDEKISIEDRERIEMSLLNLDLYFVMEDIIEPMPYSLGLVHGIMYGIEEADQLSSKRIEFCRMSIDEQCLVIDSYTEQLIKIYQKY